MAWENYAASPLGGLDVGAKLTQVLEGGREVARRKEWESTAADIIKKGNPAEISTLMTKFPEMTDTIHKAMGLSKLSTGKLLDIAKHTLAFGEVPLEQLAAVIEGAKSSGENVGLPIQLMQKLSQDPAYGVKWAEKYVATMEPDAWEGYAKASGKGDGGGQFAAIAEFDYLTQGLPEEEKAVARRIKLGLSPRASEAAEEKAMKAYLTKKAELEARYSFEPQVAGAVAAATNEAKIIADTTVDKKSSSAAWNVYDGAMSNLSQAMAGTETGPVIGLVPAITSSQQIADGAVAIMAPVLKQMFRVAGEGIFTDKDQELLLKMVPDRRDLPEARVAKIKAIDELVRTKLKVSSDTGLPRTGIQNEGEVVQPAPLYAPPTGEVQRVDPNDPLGIR